MSVIFSTLLLNYLRSYSLVSIYLQQQRMLNPPVNYMRLADTAIKSRYPRMYCTPLQVARRIGNDEMAETLIEHGATD